MATLTRLASTLTARYYPSQTLTDAFYLDGRLCGKRETRQADITIDKDERGFFFSIFTHPTIQGFEPGSLPPFEPQLRDLCNEVKNGHKEIDAMIEKFLSTAVEVAGTMKLSDSETRNPYFSGVIIRDSEAFAVTIGNGLAFLYRDDTVFPLTDAGIPMEPIDAYGNRVGDFQYYCSSKTANALWSNFFTLTPDDCIILCNKAVYDALGQREILRILTDADDQCDAAGLILTQASARMPNTPMQISISFVENVTKEEKHGLFGRKKKNKSYEDENHTILESTVEGGEVGAAAKAIADAGFVNLTPEPGAVAAAAGTVAAAGAASGTAAGLVFGENAVKAPDAPSGDLPEFPDKAEAVKEVSAEEVMKNIFGEMQKSSKEDSQAVKAAAEAAAVAAAEAPSEPVINEAEVKTPSKAFQPDDEHKTNPYDLLQTSPFVVNVDKTEDKAPQAAPVSEEPPVMKTVSSTEFVPEVDDSPTKPVENLNSVLFSKEGSGILAKAMADIAASEPAPKAVETKPEELKQESADAPADITAPSIGNVSIPLTGLFVAGADAAGTAAGAASSSATGAASASSPVIPVAPVVPEVPQAPSAPDFSGVPVVNEDIIIPAAPVSESTPSKDEAIVFPAFNDNASESSAPKAPEMPVINEAPAAPAAVIPEAPSAPEAPAPVIPETPVVSEAPVIPAAPEVVNEAEEIVFAPGDVTADTGDVESETASVGEPFDPYGKTAADELKNVPPIVFGDDASMTKPVQTEPEGASSIPVPEFDLKEEKPDIGEEDKLNVDFPEIDAPSAEPALQPEVSDKDAKAEEAPASEPVKTEAPAAAPAEESIVLPFGNMVEMVDTDESAKSDDIPEMPLYDGGNFDTPVNAVSSEENINAPAQDASLYGDYSNSDASVEAQQVPPYQPYGGEAFPESDQNSYGTYNAQQADPYAGGAPMNDNNDFVNFGNGMQDDGTVDLNQAYGAAQAPQEYQDNSFQPGYVPQPGSTPAYDGYQNSYEQPGYDSGEQVASASSSASLDDEWFNNILGVDDSGSAFGGEQTQAGQYGFPNAGAVPSPQQQAQYSNPGQTSYRPAGSGPSSAGRPSGSAPRVPQSGGNRGGNGGGKKMKLNRNGYMFIAFIAIVIVCLIIVVALIIKGCSSKEPKETTAPTNITVESQTETTPAPTETTLPDPAAPIGYFQFSEDIGYRTWWDLFHTIYGIDIENNKDSRITTIINYNNYYKSALDPSTYYPNAGDKLLLPPKGVIDGTIAFPGATDANAGTGTATGDANANANAGTGDANANTGNAETGTNNADAGAANADANANTGDANAAGGALNGGADTGAGSNDANAQNTEPVKGSISIR